MRLWRRAKTKLFLSVSRFDVGSCFTIALSVIVSGGSLYASVCLFLFVSFLPLAAQDASIAGTVSDPQQVPIPKVSVTLSNVDTGIAVRANTDVEGNYEFGFVRPGNYMIKVEHPGFRAFQQGPIKLDVDGRVRVNVGLELGEMTSTVTVEAG